MSMPGARDAGASAVEYALIVSAIAAVAMSAVVALGSEVHSSYIDFCKKISSVAESATCR